jgi:hypothetical protein
MPYKINPPPAGARSEKDGRLVCYLKAFNFKT